jgi:hypothetical protein
MRNLFKGLSPPKNPPISQIKNLQNFENLKKFCMIIFYLTQKKYYE